MVPIRVRSIARALAALALMSLAVAGCKKKEKDSGETTAAPPPPPPPPPPKPAAPPQGDVVFKGNYTRYSTLAMRNGRVFRANNTQGSGTLKVEAGRATYTQVYPNAGKTVHVTQIYSFNDASVRPVNGGYDVALTFVRMDADTKTYNPDKNNPKLEARKQADGWQIGLLASDANNVWAGTEFK